MADRADRRATNWNWLRGEVAQAVDAFVAQLDGSAAGTPLTGRERVPNLEWSVSELAAHLASLPDVYANQDKLGARFEAPADWAAFSVDARAHIATDDLGNVADLLRSNIGGLVDSIDDPDRGRWLYGNRTTDGNIVGGILVELIMHGQDLGRLTGTTPVLTTAHAHAGLPNVMAIAPAFVDAAKARRLAGTYGLGFRDHGGHWTYEVSDDGVLTVTEGRPTRADARMLADAAAFLLISLGRMNPYVAALKGRTIAYGRKPWRLKALGEVAVDGV